MKLKRIIAAFNGKLESLNIDRNVKRISRSIDIAKDNALDTIEELDCKKADLVESLPTVTDFNKFLQDLSDLIEEQENQTALIKRLEDIEKYLNEEITVKDEKKE
jgi:hypothetical protein